MNDGRKRKPQKHQNKTAFKVMFDPKSDQIHKKVSFRGLCKRCTEQLTWKIKYNKYKKMTEPTNCKLCTQKNVLRSYMRACEKCYIDNNVCPKCLDAFSEEQKDIKLNELEEKKQHEFAQRKMNDFIKTLKERSRRTVKRLYDKGKIVWNNEQGLFVDEDDNPIILHFKSGLDKNGIKGQNDEDDDQDDMDLVDSFGDEDDNFGEIQKIENKDEGIEEKIQLKKLSNNRDIKDDIEQFKSEPECLNSENEQGVESQTVEP